MLRSMMQIYSKGSAEAVELYIKAFNATLGYIDSGYYANRVL